MPFIRLNAGNDKNGNPRRAYVLLGNTGIVGAWNEGYFGLAAIPRKVRDLNGIELVGNAEASMPTIPTTRSYLRSVLAQYGEKA